MHRRVTLQPVMDSSLTADDFDWLRKLKAATDAERDPPPIPMNIAAKLGRFGLAKRNSIGAFTITSKGRDALLEQDMRDAEDR
jgi:hypothetical protein